MGFTQTISYWSRPAKEGEKTPTSDDVCRALKERIESGHFVGQPEHIKKLCEDAGLSADQVRQLIDLFAAGSRTIKTNIRKEYLQTVTALQTLLAQPTAGNTEGLAA